MRAVDPSYNNNEEIRYENKIKIMKMIIMIMMMIMVVIIR